MSSVALASVVASFSFGCAPSQGPGAGPSGAMPDLGSINVQLQLAGGIQLRTVDYRITGPAFMTKGSLQVAGSTTVSGVIADIPSGTGYTLDLTAGDVFNQLTGCHGASPFDVVAGVVTPVAVHLACHESPPEPLAVPLPPVVMLALGALLLLCGVRAMRRLR